MKRRRKTTRETTRAAPLPAPIASQCGFCSPARSAESGLHRSHNSAARPAGHGRSSHATRAVKPPIRGRQGSRAGKASPCECERSRQHAEKQMVANGPNTAMQQHTRIPGFEWRGGAGRAAAQPNAAYSNLCKWLECYVQRGDGVGPRKLQTAPAGLCTADQGLLKPLLSLAASLQPWPARNAPHCAAIFQTAFAGTNEPSQPFHANAPKHSSSEQPRPCGCAFQSAARWRHSFVSGGRRQQWPVGTAPRACSVEWFLLPSGAPSMAAQPRGTSTHGKPRLKPSPHGVCRIYSARQTPAVPL